MSDDPAFLDKTGGMPTGDDAEQALTVIRPYVSDFIVTPLQKSSLLPHDLQKEMPNIHRCLVAFLAVMRMSEAKREQEGGEKPH